VGGTPGKIAAAHKRIQSWVTAPHIHFPGPIPSRQLAAVFQEVDALVSPRLQGINTPMKLYSYLDSGKPVLATRRYTHTQAVNDDAALLVEPNVESMAEGMRMLADNPDMGHKLSTAAKELVQSRYSREVFGARIREIYDLAFNLLDANAR
jgi:glycosyltransferase involved in cell wall biosynthesis